MAKIKLELRTLSPEALRDLAAAHQAALATPEGLLLFPAPQPAPAMFDPKLAAFVENLASIIAAENALSALRRARDQLIADLGNALNMRSKDIEIKADGRAELMLKAGFQLQSARSPTTTMPSPQGLRAEIGAKPGEVDLSCHAVRRAKMYVWECRTHLEGVAPEAWSQIKMGTRSVVTATGLATGKHFSFRVKALGPKDTESPWSDEAVEMAR